MPELTYREAVRDALGKALREDETETPRTELPPLRDGGLGRHVVVGDVEELLGRGRHERDDRRDRYDDRDR